MPKIKDLIKQLSLEDFEQLYASLLELGADKQAELLKMIHEDQMTEAEVRAALQIGVNAYRTLNSRVKKRVEEYMLQHLESPKLDLLKKVANLKELVFAQRPSVAITTLKKIEKELINYDLSHELVQVYQALKKLHLHSKLYFEYSQIYNRHVAYLLTVDKVEIMLGEYFKKYGDFLLNGGERTQLELNLRCSEIISTAAKYPDSHRLWVYKTLADLFHRIFVPIPENNQNKLIEAGFKQLIQVLEQYPMDITYTNLQWVVEYLQWEYWHSRKQHKEAEVFYEKISPHTDRLLTNFDNYTFPGLLLISSIRRATRLNQQGHLYQETATLLKNYVPDVHNIPQYILYFTHKAMGLYFEGQYEPALAVLTQLDQDVTFKRHQVALLEIKQLQLLMYVLLMKQEAFLQGYSSLQRQLRRMGKTNFMHTHYLLKFFKALVNYMHRRSQPEALRPEETNHHEDRIRKFFIRIGRYVPKHQFCLITFALQEKSLLKKLLQLPPTKWADF